LELLEAAGAADVSSPALLLAYWAASGHPPPGPPPASVDWQQRCVELELELHQFRMQAGRVRDLLRDKVGPENILIMLVETTKSNYSNFDQLQKLFSSS